MKSNTYFVKKYDDIIHIYDPVFRCNLWYIKVIDFKKAKTTLKRSKVNYEFKEKTGGGFSVFEKGDNLVFLLWTRGAKSDIVHECSHATRYILSSRGIPITEDTDELYAYYNAFLFKAITEGK